MVELKAIVKGLALDFDSDDAVRISATVYAGKMKPEELTFDVGFTLILDEKGGWAVTDGTRPVIRFMDKDRIALILSCLIGKGYYWKVVVNTGVQERVDLEEDEIVHLRSTWAYLYGEGDTNG